jgi:hypothetical protein
VVDVGDNTEVTNVRLLHNAGNYLQKNSLNKKMLLALLQGLYAARADFTHFLHEKRIGVVENLLLSRNITNGSGNLT